MRLQSMLDVIAPLPFWVNHEGGCERYKDAKDCTIDGEMVYITTDAKGELTFEIKEDEK